MPSWDSPVVMRFVTADVRVVACASTLVGLHSAELCPCTGFLQRRQVPQSQPEADDPDEPIPGPSRY